MNGPFDNEIITDLRDKEFRDAFVAEHIRTGIAYQIRALRDARDLSQAQLGELTRKPQTTIARLESPDYGRYSLTTLLEMASGMDIALLVRFVSFSDLLERTRDLSPEALNVPSFGDDSFVRPVPKSGAFAAFGAQQREVTQNAEVSPQTLGGAASARLRREPQTHRASAAGQLRAPSSLVAFDKQRAA